MLRKSMHNAFRSLLAISILCVVKGQFLSSGYGSCSKKCTTKQEDKISTLMPNLSSTNKYYPCSCSPSCAVYKDCCYDSLYKHTDHPRPTSNMCLFLQNRGSFRAIGSCPKSWKASSEYCHESLGHLKPVTSTKTGITYTNRFCAICNEDIDQLVTWKVQMMCRSSSDDSSHDKFVYRRGRLWRVSSNSNEVEILSECNYKMVPGVEKFMDNVELHLCDRREKGKCSSTWEDTETEKACKSYLDPVYIKDKVYRNIHCAACNYEKTDHSHCIPPIVEYLDVHGVKPDIIFDYCMENKLNSCLHYFATSKGRRYSFSEIFKINSRACIPSDDKRCCDGYRYDFRHKRCRKLAN